MINARDVNFWYGDFHALKGISMEIEEKSVLLSALPDAVNLLFSACLTV